MQPPFHSGTKSGDSRDITTISNRQRPAAFTHSREAPRIKTTNEVTNESGDGKRRRIAEFGTATTGPTGQRHRDNQSAQTTIKNEKQKRDGEEVEIKVYGSKYATNNTRQQLPNIHRKIASRLNHRRCRLKASLKQITLIMEIGYHKYGLVGQKEVILPLHTKRRWTETSFYLQAA